MKEVLEALRNNYLPKKEDWNEAKLMAIQGIEKITGYIDVVETEKRLLKEQNLMLEYENSVFKSALEKAGYDKTPLPSVGSEIIEDRNNRISICQNALLEVAAKRGDYG